MVQLCLDPLQIRVLDDRHLEPPGLQQADGQGQDAAVVAAEEAVVERGGQDAVSTKEISPDL